MNERGDLRAREQRRVDQLNKFRTSAFGVALFYGYLFAILITAIFLGRVVLENHNTAIQAHRALCSLKQERQHRVADVRSIVEHPNDPGNEAIIRTIGLPILERSLTTAKADLKALEDVKC